MGRVYGPDLMLSVLEKSSRLGLTSFFYGGAEGVAADLAAIMKKRFPGLRVVGTYCPPFRALAASEKSDMIDMINEASPDFLWVGLGAPKQDLFMAEYRRELNCRVLVGVGAAFDFHAGTLKMAPPWMQRYGLEWLFRLAMEPRRLWRRYVFGNSIFIARLCLALMAPRRGRKAPEPRTSP